MGGRSDRQAGDDRGAGPDPAPLPPAGQHKRHGQRQEYGRDQEGPVLAQAQGGDAIQHFAQGGKKDVGRRFLEMDAGNRPAPDGVDQAGHGSQRPGCNEEGQQDGDDDGRRRAGRAGAHQAGVARQWGIMIPGMLNCCDQRCKHQHTFFRRVVRPRVRPPWRTPGEHPPDAPGGPSGGCSAVPVPVAAAATSARGRRRSPKNPGDHPVRGGKPGPGRPDVRAAAAEVPESGDPSADVPAQPRDGRSPRAGSAGVRSHPRRPGSNGVSRFQPDGAAEAPGASF